MAYRARAAAVCWVSQAGEVAVLVDQGDDGLGQEDQAAGRRQP